LLSRGIIGPKHGSSEKKHPENGFKLVISLADMNRSFTGKRCISVDGGVTQQLSS
jgi:hypothetical protein